MADVYLNAEATFRDDKGLTSRLTFYVHGTGLTVDAANTDARANAQDVIDAAAAISNAVVASQGGIATGPSDSSYGANATYESASMGAMLLFRDSVGGSHRYVVPAPLSSAFAADGVTVNNAGDVATLTTAMIANVTSRAGTPLTTFVGGHFLARRRKLLRTPLKGPGL